ncbi:MAG: hypothetical protein H6779_03255 [Candidatus Nomurabacteria bacterium]|nr:hypothetical protein [Candidatus Nomurabacteria bacterium]USN87408.1 MAG: hypothetical protein H6779_03255 [Candidatus Nomurabacteria bacterium]
MSRPRTSHYKIVISGHIVEAMQYAKAVGYSLESSKKQAPYRKRRALAEQEITASSLSRTKNRLIRLVNANCFMWTDIDGQIIKPQFLTYTIHENIKTVEQANPLFTNYIKRLNYHTYGTKASVIKYVVVPEFQKRGAVHYHAVFFNLPMINSRREYKTGEFAKVWEHGYIKKRNISKVPNVGLYMTKYMTKDAMDRRLVGRKKYFSSRGLLKPEVITYEHLAGDMMDYLSELKPMHAYITSPNDERPFVENPTFCATYNLSTEQLHDLRNFYTLDSANLR